MNRKLVIAAVAASALAVGGTTAAFAGDSAGTAAPLQERSQDDDRDGREDKDDRDGRDEAKALAGAQLSAREAIDKALASVGGTVESVELDDEAGGRLAWDADVLGDDGTWHEVRVDAGSGKVTQQQTDDRDDRADDDRDDQDDQDDRDDD